MTSRSHVQRKASSNSSPAPQSFLKSRLFPTPSEVTPHQVTLEQQVQLEKAQHFHQNFANIPLAPRESFPSSIQPKFTIGAQRSKSEPEADRLTKQEMQHLNTNTAGRDVLFPEGAYQPRKRGGQELIVRELAHVVQKRVGDKCLLAENSAWNSDGGVTLQMVDEKNILGQKSDEENINCVNKVIEMMGKKYYVANEVGKETKSAEDVDTMSRETTMELAEIKGNKELNAIEIMKKIKPHEGTEKYYKVLGDKMNQSTKMSLGVRCNYMNAAVLDGLIKEGFTGTVHKGSIGKSTGFGHEFLILFLEDPEKERILDIWLSQQTKESPLIPFSDYTAALDKLPGKGEEYSVNQKKKTVGEGKNAMISLAKSGVKIGKQLWPPSK